MKVLIIGGTGTISTYVVKRAVEQGMDVTVMNRGHNKDSLPKSVKFITGNINHEEEAKNLLKGKSFDSVIQFVAFNVNQVKRDIRLFKDKTKQYIFISTASAYQKPVQDYPITEKTPLINPYWGYSNDKIICEEYLRTVKDLPITIVRPSHTYDNKMIMSVMSRWQYEYAHIQRLLDGKPIIIPGDGTSVWTITHAEDFAKSFVDLIGNPASYNEVFHITSNKLYTWEQLTQILADALGVKAKIIHIPTDVIIKHLPEMEGPLLGDKSWSAIFDNTKIKNISKNYSSSIGYEDIAKDVVEYYRSNPDKQLISAEFEAMCDKLIDMYQKALN